MVKAILEGRKTMTRRIIKPQPDNQLTGYSLLGTHCWRDENLNLDEIPYGNYTACPYGQVGDRLWVRETWAIIKENDNVCIYDMSQNSGLFFKADNPTSPKVGKWRPSIFMPRWASRIDKIIALLRVERLLDISEADAKAEGFNSIDEFLTYWNILNKKRGYGTDINPWNWVIGW